MAIEGVDGFEAFSLRVARGLLITSIAIGSLAIVLGLLLAPAAWLLPGPDRPTLPTAPAPHKLTRADAEKWATEHPGELKSFGEAALSLSEPGAMPARLGG